QLMGRRMMVASKDERFEHAAILRDNLETLNAFANTDQQRHAELETGDQDVDVIAYHQGDVEVDIAIYMIRSGMLLGHKNFNFPVVDMTDGVNEEVLQYLFQYYIDSQDSLPSMIVAPFDEE